MIYRRKAFKTKEKFEEYLKSNNFLPMISEAFTLLSEIKNLEEAVAFCENKISSLLLEEGPSTKIIRVSFGAMDISQVNHPLIVKGVINPQGNTTRPYSILEVDKVKEVLSELSQSEIVDEEVYNVYSLYPSQRLVTKFLISIKNNIEEEILEKKKILAVLLNKEEYRDILNQYIIPQKNKNNGNNIDSKKKLNDLEYDVIKKQMKKNSEASKVGEVKKEKINDNNK